MTEQSDRTLQARKRTSGVNGNDQGTGDSFLGAQRRDCRIT
jgi:hypothetical protein